MGEEVLVFAEGGLWGAGGRERLESWRREGAFLLAGRISLGWLWLQWLCGISGQHRWEWGFPREQRRGEGEEDREGKDWRGASALEDERWGGRKRTATLLSPLWGRGTIVFLVKIILASRCSSGNEAEVPPFSPLWLKVWRLGPSFPMPAVLHLCALGPAILPLAPTPALLSTPILDSTSPRPWVLASMISLMRPEPTLFLAASFTLYHVPHLRLSSLKDRSLELMNTSFHSSLLSTEYWSTKPAGRGLAQVGRAGSRGPAWTPQWALWG